MIVIIDTKMGNVKSIQSMLRKIGVKSQISHDLEVIASASRYILPGVGSFDTGMHYLNSSGIKEVLDRNVLEYKKPILGICLGMQLLTKGSQEGELEGLGWIDAEAYKFDFKTLNIDLPVPNMGWNIAQKSKENRLWDGLDENRFYFVHSYYVKTKVADETLSSSQYGVEFASSIGKDNIYGVQFHPEKSHRYGMQLLKNFSEV